MKRDCPQHAVQDARELSQRDSELIREIKVLEGIEGAILLDGERHAEAARLQEQGKDLEAFAASVCSLG